MGKSAKPPAMREEIGLSAAQDGDVHAAHIFVAFVQRELSTLGLFSSLPERVRVRLSGLANEADRISHFLDGFYEASRPSQSLEDADG